MAAPDGRQPPSPPTATWLPAPAPRSPPSSRAGSPISGSARGPTLRRGEIIAPLENDDYQAQAAQAEAALATARAELVEARAERDVRRARRAPARHARAERRAGGGAGARQGREPRGAGGGPGGGGGGAHRRRRGRAALRAGEPREHGDPRAVHRHGAAQGSRDRRGGGAVGRRRTHPRRRGDDGRPHDARGRGRRQRGLHRADPERAGRADHARRVPRHLVPRRGAAGGARPPTASAPRCR